MIYAIIGKWNNKVQELNEDSSNLTGSEDIYEVETNFAFPEPFVADKILYRDGSFILEEDRQLEIIDETWKDLYTDYKAARVAIYYLVVSKGGFDNLTSIEKEIAARWFVVGSDKQAQVFSLPEIIALGKIYNNSSGIARKARLEAMMIELWNRLSQNQVNDIISAMNFSKVSVNYIELGQEGTLEGNPEGLFDYVEARSGTSWENTGLRVQNYTPLGMSNCAELADRVMDILVNGNY